MKNVGYDFCSCLDVLSYVFCAVLCIKVPCTSKEVTLTYSPKGFLSQIALELSRE